MSWDWEKLKEQQQRKGGGGIPPQMSDLFEKFKQLKLPGGPLLILLIIILFFGSSTFFTVGVDEVGVVQRFGKFIRITQPGLNFKLPAGIEKATKVKVRRVYKEEFGFRSTREEARSRSRGGSETASVSLMLTGDLNVALVPWIVQYRIKDPYDFLFKVADVRRLLIDMSEAAMRLVVGDRSINEVISKREEIAIEARNVLQAEMDNAESGIHIVTIEMKKTNVPGPVQPSFNEVNQAIQEKEKMIYQALEDYNKEIPTARGEADRTVKIAEGYALDRVNRAKGDASRFVAVFKEYAKAKDVTRRRLYLEMVKDLFPKLGDKYIIDSNQQNLLPLLNLGKQIGVK
ncbi:MAG: FtsH protease activity modulator HflK [Candidatus Desulfatibia sp.]|uniref:FtsH protease activity modulator HflK n=1 Tax=Candidatus Desulfatibia sp. TaxID=3101189 RepID=UPI002F31F492